MAVAKDAIKVAYPLPVYNYRVEIDGVPVGFSEVSGLSISYETTTYKESPVESGVPGPRVMHMPAQSTPVNVTLKKGIVRGKSVATLFRWINSTATNLIDKKDIFIRLCDETGTPVISWSVRNAFPTKLDAPTFDATSNDVAIESMELMADGVRIEEA
ncbi:MAG: phage tail protein [Planctomycetaceae bacterium]|nr:phage tail protein [Planctomycetaceae bacterium]MCB9950072.1 phage tail protein [Planctomycetaceae bacterium]